MPDTSNRFLLVKRLLIATVALVAVTLASVIGSRFAVESLFMGIASSKSTGLSALTSWDSGSMLKKGGGPFDKFIPMPPGGFWIARSADLRTRSSDFDRSVATLHQLVSAHHVHFQDVPRARLPGLTPAVS